MLFVNVDASFTEDAVGVGWHIKTWSDTAGAVYDEVERGGKCVEGGDTSERAEYLACINGVERALRHGDESLTLYTDCKQLVYKINTGEHLREDGSLYQRMYNALNKFDEWRVKWIPRSKNGIADSEAEASRKLYNSSECSRGYECCNIGKQRS